MLAFSIFLGQGAQAQSDFATPNRRAPGGDSSDTQIFRPDWARQKPFDAREAARPYRDPTRLDRYDPDYCDPARRRASGGRCR